LVDEVIYQPQAETGNLDVINKAKEIYTSGSQYILIDMSKVPFIANSGLVALHSIALMMRGKQPPDPQNGWNAFHSLKCNRGNGYQKHIKILNPQPKMTRLTLRFLPCATQLPPKGVEGFSC
jgi:hypothetical protein